MPTRSWEGRGLRVVVTVPESLARPLRLLRRRRKTASAKSTAGDAPHAREGLEDDGREDGVEDRTGLAHGVPVQRLRFGGSPELAATKRDPRTAVAFLSDFDEKSAVAREVDDTSTRPLSQPDSGASDDMTLADIVASLPWYHTIEMPGGVVSRGMFDHRPLVAHYGIPQTLAGLRCLDMACSNGFWAFEFERRGGRVTALDIASWADWDLPTGAPVPFASLEQTKDSEANRRATPSAADPFVVARDALGSRVERVQQNLYDVDPDELGTFEFVHAGDVLLHLERPLAAQHAQAYGRRRHGAHRGCVRSELV
jgi:hypothetical protein